MDTSILLHGSETSLCYKDTLFEVDLTRRTRETLQNRKTVLRELRTFNFVLIVAYRKVFEALDTVSSPVSFHNDLHKPRMLCDGCDKGEDGLIKLASLSYI